MKKVIPADDMAQSNVMTKQWQWQSSFICSRGGLHFAICGMFRTATTVQDRANLGLFHDAPVIHQLLIGCGCCNGMHSSTIVSTLR